MSSRIAFLTAALLCACPCGRTFAQTLFGIDVLARENFASLTGAKVSLITNHTGTALNGASTVDLFRQAPGIELINILSPEHGFSGQMEHGVKVEHVTDEAAGFPIFSLYGATTRPTAEMLEGVDTLVFDIQDAGTRYYTYIATMAQALEEASRRNITFVVLDRPNPIRGDIIEGDLLDPDIKRMTGYFPIPIRHSLTVGELALWHTAAQNIKTHVKIVKMEGWSRDNWFEDTGHSFIPPSPNIQTVTGALLYCGIGCFEATNVSVGRGTDTPFHVFGAPWLDGKKMARLLNRKKLPGASFKPAHFVPAKDLYQNQKCGGVFITVTDRETVRPVRIFLESFLYLYQEYPHDFKPDWEEIRVVTGSNKLRKAAEGQMTLEELLSQYDKVGETFRQTVSPFLIY